MNESESGLVTSCCSSTCCQRALMSVSAGSGSITMGARGSQEKRDELTRESAIVRTRPQRPSLSLVAVRSRACTSDGICHRRLGHYSHSSLLIKDTSVHLGRHLSHDTLCMQVCYVCAHSSAQGMFLVDSRPGTSSMNLLCCKLAEPTAAAQSCQQQILSAHRRQVDDDETQNRSTTDDDNVLRLASSRARRATSALDSNRYDCQNDRTGTHTRARVRASPIRRGTN